LIDNKEVAIIGYRDREIMVNISGKSFDEKKSIYDLEIMVENEGRYNFDIALMNAQHKGINGSVLIDDKPEQNWDIYPLESKQKFVGELKNEKWIKFDNIKSPAIFRATLDISGKPNDTFSNFRKWNKGIAFVNGINIGRYWDIGAQYILYIPAPFLKTGKNDTFIFELHSAVNSIEFAANSMILFE
jgi:beta-galactosidase